MPFYRPHRGGFALSRSLRLSVFLFALAAVLILPIARALSHSFYPWECCSNLDCHPVDAGKVKEGGGGWTLEDGTFIKYGEARSSPDNRFHVCRRDEGKGALIRLHQKPACFWAPMGAS